MKLSISRLREQKSENIIVLIVMVGMIILSFVIFGWSSIKEWLGSPIFWSGQDSLSFNYLLTQPKPKTYGDYSVIISIFNNTYKEIDEYEATVVIEGVEFNFSSYSHGDMPTLGFRDAEFVITAKDYAGYKATRVSKEYLDKLLNCEDSDSIKIECRIKYLKSNGETLVYNTGIYKDIIIVIISIILGLIGFFGNINIQWLRVIIKLFALPAVVVAIAAIVILLSLGYVYSPEGQAESEKSCRKHEAEQKAKASSDYKYAAHLKSACLARGDQKGAAYAQERMDKSLADMISSKGTAKAKYQSAAHTKAACTARGDEKGAAYAQERMDKSFADMVSKK